MIAGRAQSAGAVATAHHKGKAAFGRRLRFGDREVISLGMPRRFWQDLYHLSMTVSWPGLFAVLAAVYVVLNLSFGTLYASSPGCIANLNPPGFLGYFFFSVETSATVGYGDMHPQTVFGLSLIHISEPTRPY